MTESSDHPQEPSWALLRDQLVAFVNKRVESRDAAEDIVQDVYVRLHHAEPGSITNPQAWLYRAARNATIDHYRTRRIESPLDGAEQLLDENESNLPNDATRELAGCLRPLILQLPDTYQRALTLVDLQGTTHLDAAHAEGISVSGMKSRVQRGRAKLGDLLTQCCAVETDALGAVRDYECTC